VACRPSAPSPDRSAHLVDFARERIAADMHSDFPEAGPSLPDATPTLDPLCRRHARQVVKDGMEMG